MAIRNVLIDGDEILRKVSKPVVDFDERLGVLLDDMRETMYKKEGAGLSAVQVGVLKRAFVMHAGKEYRECINPKILKTEGQNKIRIEGCLSIPGKCGYVDRPEKVWVEYQDRTGKKLTKKFTGFEAKCFCHESDHLDGILYIDKATEMFNDRDEYNREKNEKQSNSSKKLPATNVLEKGKNKSQKNSNTHREKK